MTANNTADIYFEGRVYKDVTLDELFKTRNDKQDSFTSYELTGSHNFTDFQIVVEGKDYELRYQKSISTGEYVNCVERDYSLLRDMYRRIAAVPLVPQLHEYVAAVEGETVPGEKEWEHNNRTVAPQSEQEQTAREIFEKARRNPKDVDGNFNTTPAADTVNKTEENRFKIDYMVGKNRYTVVITTEANLNKALIKFATYYHNVTKVFESIKL